MKRIGSILILLLAAQPCFAQEGAGWRLPLELNDQNTQVRFEVDSTWHMVHGEVSGISGMAEQRDPNDPASIQAEIHFPVKKFDTGWGMRDSSLYDHMAADTYPEVTLEITGLKGGCGPEEAAAGGCSGTLQAKLHIRDVSRPVDLPVTIVRQGADYLASGSYTFRWAAYNVEDPSIMLAKVKPDVKVLYSVRVPAQVDGENAGKNPADS